jgi:ornithine cyclodeaminase/alanine dehydrogenase-like protein (mu-crystallin family)
MPAVLDDVMGLKIMTLVEGVGNRYLVLLYEVKTGELLALFDADELTRVRTAATTALAAKLLCGDKPITQLGIIGTGFEAVGHLEFFASSFPLRQVVAYSPNAERRAAFAQKMSHELGIDVQAAATSTAALANMPVVVLATKAKVPVIDGNDFSPGAVVLSIGSTRLDLRELDNRTLERAASLAVDDKDAVLHESADIVDSIAAGAFSSDHIVSLGQLSAGQLLEPASGKRDLIVFKSVGTALQDLALARELYFDSNFKASGRDLGELSTLKPFSFKAPAASVS